MALDGTHYMTAGVAQADAALAAAWADLAGRSLQPAARNHPDFVFPLLPAAPGARLLTAGIGPDLHLAFPARQVLRPLPLWTSLVTPIAHGGEPHADRHQGAAALRALLARLGQPVVFQAIAADGPFFALLQDAGLRSAVLRRWQRAGLRLGGSFAQWFDGNFDRKRRKELRRLRARLAEQGRLGSDRLLPGEDAGAWVEDLLRLEMAGWKGARGTALRQQQGFAEALRAVAARLQAGGRLRFWRLALDGQAIATLFAVVEGEAAWLGKIAHDPAFARYSPGVLLTLEATQALFEEEGLRLADSCAIPGHPMIDGIWRDRLPMADVMVASPHVSAAQFSATVTSEKLRQAVRTGLRDALVRYAGWKRS